MRSAFYMAYDHEGCEHVKLMSPEIDKRLASGPPLVSAHFVIPYPPGFPIMVPGQVIKADTIEFMRKLDVKEIHGYDANLGLKLISPAALEGQPEAKDGEGGGTLEEGEAGGTAARSAGQPTHDSRAHEKWQTEQIMIDWFFATLRQYPEIAIFLTLGIGYYFGKFTFKGIGLGAVTATLLAGVLIGQIGITIAQPLKATVFLMFLFAVGYGVGPQFVRGVAKDGVPQALFSAVQCVFSLLVPVAIAKIAGYDLGYAAGLYSGSQTISAAMGLSTDAINRTGPGRRSGQGPDRLDAGRLRRDLHVRHDGLGDRDRRARPQAARHRSRRRLQGLRGEARRRQQGTRRPRHGVAPLGSAGVPRGEGREGRWPAGRARPRRWCPTRASSSCASAATGRSKRRPRIPSSRKATSWRSPAPAKCW